MRSKKGNILYSNGKMYIQQVVPLYKDIEIDKIHRDKNGKINIIPYYEDILKHYLKGDITIDDFDSVGELDSLIGTILANQNKHLFNYDIDNVKLNDKEILFYMAIKSGFVDYKTAKTLPPEEIMEIVGADIYFKQEELKAIKKSCK